jgi:V8-like Glu-specific endopeptidase
MTSAGSSNLSLRVGDPETARLVAFLDGDGDVVGAGCLISAETVLTCWHVVEAAANGSAVDKGAMLRMRICGLEEPLEVAGCFEKKSGIEGPVGDLALIKVVLPRGHKLRIPEAEFAAPFRHGGKTFSVVGFPEGVPTGYYASGLMRGANVAGVVQLDGAGEILVQAGFSGAPVWSSNLNAYVGLVVTELHEHKVAWCIPARVLCRFYPDLSVRFRVPQADRPDVHDFRHDDPNVPLFGNASHNDKRRLQTKVTKDSGEFRVDVRYECLPGHPARGRYVTFVTHPSLSSPEEDAYELFSEVEDGIAANYFWTKSSFTVAAIGDGGDTALTCDIGKSPGRPKDFE